MTPADVHPKWIRNPSDEEAVLQGCYFDEAAAERPILFVERFCKQSIGRWKGKPLTLIDWQKDFLRRLFGWKRADGRRRFTKVYLEVGKKNGKSTVLSALAILFEVADGEGAPEIHILAADKQQAGIVFNEAARMIEASPALKARLKVIGGSLPSGRIEKRIIDIENNGVILCNSSVADTKDGFNPSKVIFDELHRQPNRDLWTVYLGSMAAREEPMRISITTAGEDESGLWHEEREHAEQINDGRTIDIEFLGVVYRADPKDDIDSPDTWRKANPSLGVTFSEEDFRRDLEQAKLNPIDLADFLRRRLNIVTRASAKFIDPAKWALCKSTVPSIDKLRHLPCFGGGDLSAVVDLSAIVFVFGDQERGFFIHCRCYLPEANIVDLEHKHKVPYRVWAEKGWITLTPGEAIDYDFIRRDINEVAAETDFRLMRIDPHNAIQLCTQLLEQDGLKVQTLQQGFISLNAPTKELLRLILTRKIKHDGHPVMTWCLLNAIAVEDSAGNIKLDKKKSRQKIDLAAALVDAISAATSSDASSAESVYQTRGLLSV